MRSISKTSVVWFRRDLRIEDNPALSAGARDGAVIAVFIWSPEEAAEYFPGRVSRWWLKHSLAHLDSSLRNLGLPLITKRSPDSLSALVNIFKSTGASQLLFNQLYDPPSLVRDYRVKEALISKGIYVQSFNADLLYEPWEIYDAQGFPFTNFTGFWERCLSMSSDPHAPLLPPKKLIAGEISGFTSDDLEFEDEAEIASNALLARAWSPGWTSANKVLNDFIDGRMAAYAKNRQKTDSGTTSFLSPHLHFGEVSVRKVFHMVRTKQLLWSNDGNSAGEEGVSFFLKSIFLREYSRYNSFHRPESHERLMFSHLRFFPWVEDEGLFKVWKQGRTGYPLVDAGMRELWATGWQHDGIRVVVSMFFVKVLRLPWRWGMKYFWDTLLDADLESDSLGWQYISGAFSDSPPVRYIDHPLLQGSKVDPDGEYVRKWLPELARLPTEWIHHPWNSPSSVLQAAGVELGSNYPLPIVGIDEARVNLQLALSQMWRLETAWGVGTITGSAGDGDSTESTPITVPAKPRRGDQMVPSLSSSSLKTDDDDA